MCTFWPSTYPASSDRYPLAAPAHSRSWHCLSRPSMSRAGRRSSRQQGILTSALPALTGGNAVITDATGQQWQAMAAAPPSVAKNFRRSIVTRTDRNRRHRRAPQRVSEPDSSASHQRRCELSSVRGRLPGILPFVQAGECGEASLGAGRRLRAATVASSSNARQLVAHPASGTTTISTCSPTPLSSAASSRFRLEVDTGFLALRRSNAHTRLCRNPRGRDGGVREELAAGVIRLCPH
jgi:hypothetical protein